MGRISRLKLTGDEARGAASCACTGILETIAAEAMLRNARRSARGRGAMTRRQCKPFAASPRCLTGRLVGAPAIGPERRREFTGDRLRPLHPGFGASVSTAP